MTEGTLQFVPKGWRVVPEEATEEQIYEMDKIDFEALMRDLYKAAIKAAPRLTTPPVLRWEDGSLKIYDFELSTVSLDPRGWAYTFTGVSGVWFKRTEQEARRAAEKALGLPEIEEV